MASAAPFRIVIAGHVDHGKSTLIGRLLHECGALAEGRKEELEASCKRRGVPFEWSFALDAFQAERDQAITIDTTQVRLSTGLHQYVLIDAPGHREFLKNMMTGASEADAGILVVDASEGLREQTRRHAHLLSLLGVTQIGVALNKMDAVNYSRAIYEELCRDIEAYLTTLGLKPKAIVPMAAREGVMIAARGNQMPWYAGETFIDALATFTKENEAVETVRFPVQDVYRLEEERVLVGRLESGTIHIGDKLVFSPRDESAHVAAIKTWPIDEKKTSVYAGESIGIVLAEDIFVERGYLASDEQSLPILSDSFEVRLFWLDTLPLSAGQAYILRMGPIDSKVSVHSIEAVTDTQTLGIRTGANTVSKNEVANVKLRAPRLLALDDGMQIILYDGQSIVGVGRVSLTGHTDQRRKAQPKSTNIRREDYAVTPAMRAQRQGHASGIFWMTGLSASGKSTLAKAVEQELYARGIQAYVLDGDNIRHGLNSDLGFSPEDRSENIRRVSEVAALLAAAGQVVITAFISPYQSDRERARAVAPDLFHEIYVRADVQACEARNPKGLYQKARAGEIADFTGIDAPYDIPQHPDLIIDTQQYSVEECTARIVDYIERCTMLHYQPKELTLVF